MTTLNLSMNKSGIFHVRVSFLIEFHSTFSIYLYMVHNFGFKVLRRNRVIFIISAEIQVGLICELKVFDIKVKTSVECCC